MSLPSELRQAAEKLSAYRDVELGSIAVALSALLNREADIQTTATLMKEAGLMPSVVLDASKQMATLAYAINRSSL